MQTGALWRDGPGRPPCPACAARLERRAVLVIAGVAPYGPPVSTGSPAWARTTSPSSGPPCKARTISGLTWSNSAEHLKDVTPAGIITSLESLLPEVDRAALTGEFGEDIAASFHEGLRLGVDGWLDDDFAFTKPWGFDLDEVAPRLPLARLGRPHGPLRSRPMVVVPGPGRYRPPRKGEGHLSVGLGALELMLDELVRGRGPKRLSRRVPMARASAAPLEENGR